MAGSGLQFSWATKICQAEQGGANLCFPTEIYKRKLPVSLSVSWGRHSQAHGMPVAYRTGRCQKTHAVQDLESVPGENSLNALFKYLGKELEEEHYIQRGQN